MKFEFRLPDLGEGITEGEVVKWRVAEGDLVEEHQVIAEVETDKAIVEVPSPRKGKVARLDRSEGEEVAVGETLLTLEVEEAEPAPGERGEAKRRPSVSVVGEVPEEEGVLATPRVRRLAARLRADLSKVEGTGRGGAVTEEDVRGAAAEGGGGKAAPAEDAWGAVERVAIKGVRKSISKNLLLMQKRSAFVTGTEDADITGLWEMVKKEKGTADERGIHLTLLPFFMKAAGHALREHPALNASVDEDTGEILVKKYYNFGVAVDTPDGLMVPVVRGVDGLTILELAGRLQELGRKARERRITLDELRGNSFTITNYGVVGGVYATPILNPPDVAILGTGRVRAMPWVVDGAVVPRRILPLSLTFDHRVADGVEAARFLGKVVRYLEDPGLLFIESS